MIDTVHLRLLSNAELAELEHVKGGRRRDGTNRTLREQNRGFQNTYLALTMWVILVAVPGMIYWTAWNEGESASAFPWLVVLLIILLPGMALPFTFVSRDSKTVANRLVRDYLDEIGYEKRAYSEPANVDEGRIAPHYPVTGEYNPSLYMARGGRATSDWLQASGYEDWETYEANKPD